MPIVGIAEVADTSEGTGVVRFVYNISGAGEVPSVTEGAGTVRTVFGIDGNAEVGDTTNGNGSLKHNLTLTGNADIGETNYALDASDPPQKVFLNQPSSGDVRTVYSIAGSGETPTATEGTGVVAFGTLIGHADIGTATEGTGTVDLIPNLSAIAVQATLDQINTELQRQLEQTVSVTFDATAYDQRADQLTLFAMKDIKDNWASYTDLKNGSDIDWGVADGTILTMTQAEFGTFYDDTMTAWRDRADRVIEKARDWADSGVSLATIQDDANWA